MRARVAHADFFCSTDKQKERRSNGSHMMAACWRDVEGCLVTTSHDGCLPIIVTALQSTCARITATAPLASLEISSSVNRFDFGGSRAQPGTLQHQQQHRHQQISAPRPVLIRLKRVKRNPGGFATFSKVEICRFDEKRKLGDSARSDKMTSTLNW